MPEILSFAAACAAGALLFLCALLGFRYGLYLGMRAARGEEPKPFKGPFKAMSELRDRKETKKQAESQSEFFGRLKATTAGRTRRESLCIRAAR